MGKWKALRVNDAKGADLWPIKVWWYSYCFWIARCLFSLSDSLNYLLATNRSMELPWKQLINLLVSCDWINEHPTNWSEKNKMHVNQTHIESHLSSIYTMFCFARWFNGIISLTSPYCFLSFIQNPSIITNLYNVTIENEIRVNSKYWIVSSNNKNKISFSSSNNNNNKTFAPIFSHSQINPSIFQQFLRLQSSHCSH